MTVPLTAIHGIGTSTAETLVNHGIKTVKALANATVERIAAVPGFSEARASKVKEQALALLAQKPKGTGKKNVTKRTTESKSKPAPAVFEEIVQAMDEAGAIVTEAVQEALEANKKATEAGHDVTESLVEQNTHEIEQAKETPEVRASQETSETLILAPAKPKDKPKKQKSDKRGKKKKGKKKKNKKKSKKK